MRSSLAWNDAALGVAAPADVEFAASTLGLAIALVLLHAAF
jgi:hypothetical protein